LKDEIYASNRQWRETQEQILSRRRLILTIAETIDRGLADKIRDRSSVPWEWATAEEGCLELLGHLRYQSEMEAPVGSGEPIGVRSPIGVESQLHPGVWLSASSAWEGGRYTEAVKAGSFFVMGSLLPDKLNTFDLAGIELIAEALSLDPPRPGRPRLRLPQVTPDTEAWVRAHSGVEHVGIGCVLTMTSLALGVLESGKALQFLVALSMFAGWVDEAEVAYWRPPSA
jgi:hypothetical protein